tara:strand:+ start:1308 stop:1541 length:234 start_codon:yes stop_codon:yes gene_type:complete
MHKITDFKPLFKVAGRKFYEHPIHGDEAGVIMEYSGRYWQLDVYDKPDQYETADIVELIQGNVYTQLDQYGRRIDQC